MRFVTAAAVTVGFVCPAYGDVGLVASERAIEARSAPKVIVHRASATNALAEEVAINIQRVSVVEQVTTERTHAVMTLVLATKSAAQVEGALHLDIPLEGRAIGMAVTLAGDRMPGIPMASADASREYWKNMPAQVDPALLEYAGQNENGHSLELRAWPITSAHPATIAIELELPAGTTFTMSPGIRAKPSVKRTNVKALASAAREVDKSTSLYAGPLAMRLFAKIEPHDMLADRNAGTRHVALTEKRAEPVVTSNVRGVKKCLASAKTTRLIGSAHIRFEVAKSGDVGEIEIDAADASEAVRSCIRDEVARWHFAVTDDVTRIGFMTGVVLR